MKRMRTTIVAVAKTEDQTTTKDYKNHLDLGGFYNLSSLPIDLFYLTNRYNHDNVHAISVL